MTTKINGVKFSFIKNFSSRTTNCLHIRFCEVIQKHLNVKANDQILVDYDSKNNFILFLKKKQKSAQRGIMCRKPTSERAMNIRLGWFSNETIPTWAKQSNHAHYELLEKNTVKIDLLKTVILKIEKEYREVQKLKDRFY